MGEERRCQKNDQQHDGSPDEELEGRRHALCPEEEDGALESEDSGFDGLFGEGSAGGGLVAGHWDCFRYFVVGLRLPRPEGGFGYCSCGWSVDE